MGILLAASPLTAQATCDVLSDPSLLTVTAAPQCGAYLDENGQDAQFCQWKFDYRADAARVAFDMARNAMAACFPDTHAPDDQVNHPDSYDQVIFDDEYSRVSLALKDKAGHDATYLFLRIETAP